MNLPGPLIRWFRSTWMLLALALQRRNESRHERVSVLRRKPHPGSQVNEGAFVDGASLHVAGGVDRHSAGHFDFSPARMEQAGSWECQHHSDNPEPCAFRISAPGALDWSALVPPG